MDFKFSDLQKKWNDFQEEQKQKEKLRLDNSENEKQAERLFQDALYEWKVEESINKAIEAYELCPDNYQYKVFALKRYSDKEKKYNEFKELVDKVNRDIEVSKQGLYILYDEDEIKSDRYIELRYAYILSIIENEDYNLAIDEIRKFVNHYGYYKMKIKNLLYNAYNSLGLYEEVIASYDEEIDEDVTILVPVSFAYLKLKRFKEFLVSIERIEAINESFNSVISCLEFDEVKYNIEKSRDKYLVSSSEEMYYSFKYYYKLYANDSEFISAVNMHNKSTL